MPGRSTALGESLDLLRSLPRPFRYLLAGTVVNRAATFIIPFLSLVLKRDHGLTDAQAGLVILGWGAGSVASLLAGGLLTDSLGRRRTMLLSLLGGGGVAVALGFASSTPLFVALLVLYGFVGDLFRPAVASVIADVLPPERRAAGFAALRTAVNVGWAVGLSVGGLLAGRGQLLLFAGDGLTTLLFGAVVLLWVPETRVGGASAERFRPGLVAAALRADPVLRRVLLCALAWSLLIVSFMTVFPLTVAEWAGYPPEIYGFTLGLNGLLVALWQIPVARATSGMRRLRAAAAGMLLGGLCAASLVLFRRWEWFLAVMAVYTVGEMLVLPQALAFVSDWAPPDARGTYVGLWQASWSLVLAVSPVALLPLRAAVGDRVYWPLLLAVAVPAALLYLRLDRESDRGEILRGAGGHRGAPARPGSGAEGGT